MIHTWMALFAAGCNGSINLGKGPEADARLTADVYTWECGDHETETTYEGVFSFNIAMEYAPDGLQDRQLPAGCVYNLSMFPEDAGASGTDIPGLRQEPAWTNGNESGVLQRKGAGFYYSAVQNNEHKCDRAEDLLANGVTLSEAAGFSGATAPVPGSVDDVFTTDANGDGLIDFGEEVELEWDVDGWDEVWIQIRQERDGEAWGTVTCNASGEDGFVVDDDVWGLLTELPVEYINLYVGFQNTDVQEMEDGQKIELVTRAMAVLVVQD